MTPRGLLNLAGLTLTRPAEAWQHLQALQIPRRDRWLALVLVVALSTLVGWALSQALEPFAPVRVEDPTARLMLALRAQLEQHPFSFAITQLIAIAILVWLVTAIGRLFRGTGTFDDVLLAAVWMKAILLAVQIVQLGFVHVSLTIAAMLALIETILYLYLAVSLTRIVHGFRSPFLVAIGMILSFFVIIFVLAAALAVLGLAPSEF